MPKVLAPIGGVPFLDLLLARLRDEGVRRVVLSTGYLADRVQDHVAAHPTDGIKVSCVAEPFPLGTGGAALYASHASGLDGPVFVLNGDTFCDVPLREMARLHAETPLACATLALARVDDASRFGTVVVGPAKEGQAAPVRAFREKHENATGWINAGVYVLTPACFEDKETGHAFSLERDVFPQLGTCLFAVPFPDVRFLDIGTPEDYRRAEALFLPSTET